MKNTFFFILILFSSCEASRNLQYGVFTKHDDFDGYTINCMYGNSIDIAGDGYFEFNVHKFINSSGLISYQFYIYVGYLRDWLLIEPGETLVLLIDGNRMGFDGVGSRNNRIEKTSGDNHISESAYYEATIEQIQKIANAKEIRVKLIGSRRIKEGKFMEKNISSIKSFLDEYAIN